MTNKLIDASIVASLLVAIAMPVFAQTTPTTAPSKGKIDTACMQSTVDKRDSALITAVDTFGTAVKTALQTRKDALKAAWGNTDVKARRSAIKAAWNTYAATSRDARKALSNSRKGIWKQFYADRKVCGPTAATEDNTSEGADSQL